MEIKEVRKHIDSFSRPRTYNINNWRKLKNRAFEIWKTHLAGKAWNGRIDIPCKEFYLMLVDSEGRLIVQDDQQLDWVNNKHTREWLKGVVRQGRDEAAKNNHRRALLYYNLALKVDGDCVEALLAKAMSQQALSELKEALTGYRKALEIDPNNYLGYLHRASLYSLMDLDQRALDDLNRVIRLNPTCADAYALRGDLHRANKDFDAAIADLRQAIRLEPNNENHYGFWARFYKDINDPISAFKTYSKILRMSPFNKEALYGIAMLRIEIFEDRRAAEQDLLLARSLGHPLAENVLCNLFADISQLGVHF